ncbi:NADPH:quinone oxidoreductase family protein [Sphingomonas sp.]|uniref:NADPH:quinone oxidoreductase family protein n=1 Tax=Sphingomonas sp. TaxID=28214 RepID=UPI002DD6BA1F|nr:NADPH:quinone oxidoreductase family protein [Sphingomonas sp.]
MTATIRSVQSDSLGPIDLYRLVDCAESEPGPGEVAVRVRMAGVSFVDVLIAAGGYQLEFALPHRPGSEFSGIVERVGAGVTSVAPGDRVFGVAHRGTLAEKTMALEGAIHRMPPDMSFEQAAVFRASYSTAYYALARRAQLKAGETVLVLGAGGAVGAAGVQIARAMGARVIASVSTDAKADAAREAGADAIVRTGGADWRDRLREETGGRGVDVVLDPVGGTLSEQAFRSLAWGGRHLVIGFTSGEISKLALNLPLLKGSALVGVDIRQYRLREPDDAARMMEELMDLRGRHGFQARIAHVLPLADFAEAMRRAQSGAEPGRILVEMEP